MGAYTFYNNKKIKLWKIEIINNEKMIEKGVEKEIDLEKLKEAEAGKILLANSKKGLFIKTIDGIIEILEIQGENAKRMKVHDFLLGNKLNCGDVLGIS